MALDEMQKYDRAEYLEKNLIITECSQRRPYVFISYASDNWEIVFKNAIVPLQRKYGLCVYADKAFDKVNDKWIVPMLRNIRGADVVVAFVSQRYIESYACFLELLTAVNNKKQVVFVSVEQELYLGNTTDQPDIERGVKKEILNQGSNIATNTNNTSNDVMRAMKSAYTSLSTLLEQDALSKYDISDAFINFFRDASVNRKSINDLIAVKRTIESVSSAVFDKALISEAENEERPVAKSALTESELTEIYSEAQGYADRNEYDKELRCLSDAIKKAPDHVTLIMKLGRAYRRNNMYNEAMECYIKALELEPDNPVGYGNIGALYLSLGTYDKAEGYLKKATQMMEQNPDQYTVDIGIMFANYAVAAGNLGKIKDAEILLNKAEKYGYADKKTLETLRKTYGIC